MSSSGLLKRPLTSSDASRSVVDQYLPSASSNVAGKKHLQRPFVTLTYAQSLDSSLALAPGVRTALSGLETKAMTHYLRSAHDAILVGAGTAVADDPALNCRLEEAVGDVGKQPRPVVVDPFRRWQVESSECLRQANAGNGKMPWVITTALPAQKGTFDIRYIPLSTVDVVDQQSPRKIFSWPAIFHELYKLGIKSVMVEGGGAVINSLLSAENASLVDSVIITIAPTWLGGGGVLVNPARSSQIQPAARLREAKWHQLGEDVVLCGRL